jgi:uncharacterized protein YceK
MKKLTALTLAIALFLSGCGSAAESQRTMPAPAAPAAPAPAAAPMNDYANMETGGFAMTTADEYDMDAEMSAAVPEMPIGGDGIAGPQAETFLNSRKVIRNASLDLQTLEFDRAVANIGAITAAYGGYMESSYVSGHDINSSYGSKLSYNTRNANFTARVPSESLDAFLDSFGGGEFNVIGRSTSANDITDSYFDSQARLDSLKLQEQRLLGMLDGATELEYMIQLEQELMRVRYEIESLTSQLNRMDGYVSHSTVNINLYEVIKYEEIDEVPVTFGERISLAFTNSWKAFGDFCQSFAVAFVSALPFLLLLAVIAAVVLISVRAAVKNRKPRKSKPQKQDVALPYTPPPETP